jgi:hypothetical protein
MSRKIHSYDPYSLHTHRVSLESYQTSTSPGRSSLGRSARRIDLTGPTGLRRKPKVFTPGPFNDPPPGPPSKFPENGGPSQGKKVPIPIPVFHERLWMRSPTTPLANAMIKNAVDPCDFVEKCIDWTNAVHDAGNYYPNSFTLVTLPVQIMCPPEIGPGYGWIDVEIGTDGVQLFVAEAEVQFFAMAIYNPQANLENAADYHWQMQTPSIGPVPSFAGNPDNPGAPDPGEWTAVNSAQQSFPFPSAQVVEFVRFERHPEPLYINIRKESGSLNKVLRAVCFGRLGQVP